MERTAFSNVCLPVVDKKRLDQSKAFCRVLSTIEVKISIFFLPKCSGRPRYFPILPTLSILSISLARALDYGGVLEEKVMADFSALITWPEARLYLDKMAIRAEQLVGFERVKNIVSSANKR